MSVSLFMLNSAVFAFLQVLFAHMQFPQGFTTWEDWVEDDEEAFHRFRQVGACYRKQEVCTYLAC